MSSSFEDPTPWPEPVEAAALLDEIVAVFLRFVVIELVYARAAALWVIHTYLLDVAHFSPLAVINAPERACGKTQFQSVIGKLVRRPLAAANASGPALYRAIESMSPTLLLDEADTFVRDRPELQGILNAGFERGGFVLRVEASGDVFEPKRFSVFCPKSVAGIALERHLPESTMSRAIVFSMRRKRRDEQVERLRTAPEGIFADIRSRIARFAQDNARAIGAMRVELPDELSDRAQDCWEPLLAIAACGGEVWSQQARAAAIDISGLTADQLGGSSELLADIREFFTTTTDAYGERPDRIRTTDLIAALTADPEKPWATWNRGKPFSPRQLAKMLGSYGIHPKTVRFGKETPKGYQRDQFVDAFQRYLSPGIVDDESSSTRIGDKPGVPADDDRF